MKQIVLIGTADTAKDIYSFIKDYKLFDVIAFAVDHQYKTEEYCCGLPVYVIEELSEKIDKNEVGIFVPIQWNYLNRQRKEMYWRLKDAGFHFVNVIAPNAVIHSMGSIGENCWIADNVVIESNVTIGNNVFVKSKAWIRQERAIVSDIHGTTRDVIEDTINIGGVTFRFIDTAGIRETNDTIESLGIERTFQKLDQAEIVLWMIDSVNAASQIEQLSEKIIPRCEGKHLIAVFNKADLIEEKQKEDLLTLLKDFSKEYTESIFISAKQRGNTEELQKMLINAAHLPTVTQNDIIVTNVRHYEALSKALEAIHRVQDGLDSQISGDFLSQDIRECIFFISDIAGEVTNDMVLQNIFQHFCIGK